MRTLIILLIVSIGACSGSDELAGPPASRVAVIEPITPTTLTATVGTLVQPPPRVRVLSKDRKPLAGERVTFVVHGGVIVDDSITHLVTIVHTDANGIAELHGWEMPLTAGMTRLDVHAGHSAVVFTVEAVAGPVAILRALEDGLLGAVGSTLFHPPRVRAEDAYENPIEGVDVRFVVSGGGSLTNSLATTRWDGIATGGEWTLGPNEGTQQIVARSGELEVTFSAYACSLPCPELLFVRYGNIHLVDFATGRSRTLTGDQLSRDPAWSPDGRWIAYARVDDDTSTSSRIMIMSADDPTVVRQRTMDGDFHSPTWSSDGERLAVAGDAQSCIWKCRMFILGATSGERPRPIREMAAQPAWSPVSPTIAYVGLSGDNGDHALYAMSPDGTLTWELIPRDEQTTLGSPSWSPDGQRIAVSLCTHGHGCDIYTVSSDGGGRERLTHLNDAAEVAWSPDGRFIAFSSPQRGIGLVPAGGGTPVFLGIRGSGIAWRP